MCRAAWPAFPDKKGGLQSRPPADSLTGKRLCPSGDGDRQADDRAAGRRDAGRGGDHHGAGRVRHGCRGGGRDGHRGDDSPGAGRRGEDRDGGNPDEDRGGHRDGDSRDGGQDGRRGDGTRGEVQEGAPFCSVPWDGACPCTKRHSVKYHPNLYKTYCYYLIKYHAIVQQNLRRHMDIPHFLGYIRG